MSIRQSIETGSRWRRWPVLLSTLIAMVLALGAVGLPALLKPSEGSAERFPLRAEGTRIVDFQGREVKMTGVNWFGMETGSFAPHGLWAQNYNQMLDQMRDSGFNTLRLPYSNEFLRDTSLPTGIDYGLNPEMRGLKGVQIMDKIVQGAERRGMMVILDQHRPTSQGQSDLWYNEQVSEQQWLDDWSMLAKRYAPNKNVVGADLHNEPKGQATWGDGNPKTDWRLAAEKGGNAVLNANPNMLVIVEGNDKYQEEQFWWGGNLKGAKEHPVRLNNHSKLVYSAHDYGPGVYNQNWFMDPNFPANMPKIWDEHWGYLEKENIAPVLMGEFGGRSVAPHTTEGKWQRALVDYLKRNDIDYTYWSWNPNSGDTGGVVLDDWKTIDQEKLKMLQTYQSPLPKPQPPQE
jgi:endoglucanase